jgi:hypothetical protein
VGPGTFFVGIEQTNTTNANLAFDTEAPVRPGTFFLGTGLPPATWSDFAPGNNFKPNVGITLDRCNNVPTLGNNGPLCDGGTLQLTASAAGAASYKLDGPQRLHLEPAESERPHRVRAERRHLHLHGERLRPGRLGDHERGREHRPLFDHRLGGRRRLDLARKRVGGLRRQPGVHDHSPTRARPSRTWSWTASRRARSRATRSRT